MAEHPDIKSEILPGSESINEGKDVTSEIANHHVINSDHAAKVDRQTLLAVLQFLKKYNLKVNERLKKYALNSCAHSW